MTNSLPSQYKEIASSNQLLGRIFDNQEITALASAARTASLNSSEFTLYGATGVIFVVDVTAVSLTPSVSITLQCYDSLSGKWFNIITATAITTTGTYKIMAFPNATAAAGSVASTVVARQCRLNCIHSDTDSITYSIGVCPVLG